MRSVCILIASVILIAHDKFVVCRKNLDDGEQLRESFQPTSVQEEAGIQARDQESEDDAVFESQLANDEKDEYDVESSYYRELTDDESSDDPESPDDRESSEGAESFEDRESIDDRESSDGLEPTDEDPVQPVAAVRAVSPVRAVSAMPAMSAVPTVSAVSVMSAVPAVSAVSVMSAVPAVSAMSAGRAIARNRAVPAKTDASGQQLNKECGTEECPQNAKAAIRSYTTTSSTRHTTTTTTTTTTERRTTTTKTSGTTTKRRPTTRKPEPEPHKWFVPGPNVCVLLTAVIRMTFDKSEFYVPGAGVTAMGSCGKTKQTITLRFEVGEITFDFVADRNAYYSFDKMSGYYNASKVVAIEFSGVPNNLDSDKIERGLYYSCNQETRVYSGKGLQIYLHQLKLEAFRQSNTTDYSSNGVVLCRADVTSLISVVVAVVIGGVALFILIVIAVVCMICGKSRRRGYESV